MDLCNVKYLVVGAGFFGSVIAERIANDLGEKVIVVDKRSHVGGNCYSKIDDKTGIEYHKYGTHIFHTSNEGIWKYINRFTKFNGYRHQVLAEYKNKVYQMPINLETINSFYNKNLKPFEIYDFLKSEIEEENIEYPKNLEEKAISLIGRSLYEAFIKGYTEKQWQKDPKDLPVSIINRLPFRTNYDESYFFDIWQGIPLEGYTAIFNKMLSSKNISVELNVDFFDIRGAIPSSCTVIYSGPIDRFFNYKHGKLEWRSLEFKKEWVDVEDFQGTSVLNFSEKNIPYIRIHEPRHLHTERDYGKDRTLVIKEFPKNSLDSDPYYPIDTSRNKNLLDKYVNEKNNLQKVIIGGRLGDYKYYDIDKVIEQALDVYEKKIKNQRTRHG